MLKEKVFARIQDFGIKSYHKLGYSTTRCTEYKFAFSNIPTEHCIILDVGSTGSLFPLQLAKMDHTVHSIDTRQYQEHHPNLRSFQADIVDCDLEKDSYDVITCISTIEHIGLKAYSDPRHKQGDMDAMNKFRELLKVGGKLIVTTPFSDEFKIIKWKKSSERVYNHEALMNLFTGFKILKEEYYVPVKSKNWEKTERSKAENQKYTSHESNLSCFLLQKEAKNLHSSQD